MLAFAWKTLWRDRLRLAITVGGVALAVLLMLVMDGLFAASARQITLYIDQSRADLFVAQTGVRNMHMANSVLPAGLVAEVAAVPGVERVEPITYFATMLAWRGESDYLYGIGIDAGATMGGPWSMAAGRPLPGPGEVVISLGQRRGPTPGVGDRVQIGGRELTVVGLSRETRTFVSSLVFLNAADAADLRGPGRYQYLLVRTRPDVVPAQVAAAIGERVAGVTVLTRPELSDSDRNLALQMGVELLQIMAAVGFAVGLGVVVLTLYAATVEQIRQYGVLKALGAGSGHLLTAMLTQALLAASAGFGLGVALTAAVGQWVPRWSPGLEIDLTAAAMARVLALILLLGAVAALPPFLRVQRVDPVDVLRA